MKSRKLFIRIVIAIIIFFTIGWIINLVISALFPLKVYPDIPLRYANLSTPCYEAHYNATISGSHHYDPQGNLWVEMNYFIPVGGYAFSRIDILSSGDIQWSNYESIQFNMQSNLTDFAVCYLEIQEFQSNGELGELLIASISISEHSQNVAIDFSQLEKKTMFQPDIPKSELNGKLDLNNGIAAIIIHGGYPSSTQTQLIYGDIRLIGTKESSQWYHYILGFFTFQIWIVVIIGDLLVLLKPDPP